MKRGEIMLKAKPSETPLFTPPGPGAWELESLHFPRPATRYLQETHPAPYKVGTHDFAKFFGLLTDGERIEFINGFAYVQELRASDAEIPERLKRAEMVIAKKMWREQLKEWDEKIKPASIAKHKKLQAVDPDSLSDLELIAHLKRCRDHHATMILQHHKFTGSALIPIGDFIVQVSDWTGLPSSEILELTRGSALLSRGGSGELERVKAVLSRDAVARAILEGSDDPQAKLDALCSLSGESGTAISEYLDSISCRIIEGFDIALPLFEEVPDVLVRTMLNALSSQAESSFDFGARISEIRAKVPAEHQGEFAELLGEVRIMYRLRDERGIYSDIWAAGIMRRAALAAGRRAAELGRMTSAELIIDCSLDEMCALIASAGGPSSEELSRRAEYRRIHTAKDAPHFLGETIAPVAELLTFPATEARVMRAYSMGMSQQFRASHVRNTWKVIHGLAASKGVYTGTARRVSSSADFDRICKGDVLVTESTTEAFNIIVPTLGAIVTDDGGLLSHAAIVSREHGIPGVVGTRDATMRIHDGALVRVDGDTGEVTVLK
jgi:phosphohistidine swiveling domain-containing protein